MEISVKGVERTIADIARKHKILSEEAERRIKNKLVTKLADATPKDTGAAAAGWRVDSKGNIVNDVEYIDELNEGHSQQAPAHFVESVVIQSEDVIPNGIIVRHK